ncbi:ABC transporter permease subunit [Occultella glacieicola]|uniref:ABC transporter permease subunit n=1 Tax=Occultella glacieicola TaxID=2518684 RepID=A0ABY2E037_9MICO|nr:ABC transporter permease subunit [Occultella glacieicola]TDE90395.1 ABC transporter permease subunit [Occultella glacieicola]
MNIPHIPLGDAADAAVDWIKARLPEVLDGISDAFNTLAGGLTDAFLTLPWPVVVVLFALLAAWVRSVRFAIFVLVGMTLTVSVELWEPAMETLSMVIIATVFAVVVAIPVGILAARSSIVSAIVRPILDFMQTMPALVYLVPVVIFFSIGYAPGVVATIIFSMAPGVRLTELGIRQVDRETVEAGHAFGGTPGQILLGIQLPLAVPTIMAGVNQVIMLGLSMVVMAGFVGAPGLGKDVTESLARVDVAHGFEAGLAIVILAIFLDRLTAAIGQPTDNSLSAMMRVRRTAALQRAQERSAGQPSTAPVPDRDTTAAAPAATP